MVQRSYFGEFVSYDGVVDMCFVFFYIGQCCWHGDFGCLGYGFDCGCYSFANGFHPTLDWDDFSKMGCMYLHGIHFGWILSCACSSLVPATDLHNFSHFVPTHLVVDW